MKKPFDEEYESTDFASSIISIKLEDFERISGINQKNKKEKFLFEYEADRYKFYPDYLIE